MAGSSPDRPVYIPGLGAGERITGSSALGALTVVAGLALGVLLMLGLDQFTPHEHEHAGPCGPGSGLALAYPVGLGLAAGAMIFVVSHEVIPETHRNGHQTSATLGLMTGFAIMVLLGTALG